MAYYKKCGKETDDEAVVCPHCGVEQRARGPIEDDGSLLWAFIGFLIPVIGIILWIVWYKDKPESSKMAGIGAFIAIILTVVVFVLMTMFAMGFPGPN